MKNYWLDQTNDVARLLMRAIEAATKVPCSPSTRAAYVHYYVEELLVKFRSDNKISWFECARQTRIIMPEDDICVKYKYRDIVYTYKVVISSLTGEVKTNYLGAK